MRNKDWQLHDLKILVNLKAVIQRHRWNFLYYFLEWNSAVVLREVSHLNNQI